MSAADHLFCSSNETLSFTSLAAATLAVSPYVLIGVLVAFVTAVIAFALAAHSLCYPRVPRTVSNDNWAREVPTQVNFNLYESEPQTIITRRPEPIIPRGVRIDPRSPPPGLA